MLGPGHLNVKELVDDLAIHGDFIKAVAYSVDNIDAVVKVSIRNIIPYSYYALAYFCCQCRNSITYSNTF